MSSNKEARRRFIKTATYAAPAILTLKALPAFARNGSTRIRGNNGVGNGEDPQPPGDPPINDAPGSPGDPGNNGGGSVNRQGGITDRGNADTSRQGGLGARAERDSRLWDPGSRRRW